MRWIGAGLLGISFVSCLALACGTKTEVVAAAASSDAGTEDEPLPEVVGVGACSRDAKFGPAVPLDIPTSREFLTFNQYGARLTPDELRIVFLAGEDDPGTKSRIVIASRPSVDVPFDKAVAAVPQTNQSVYQASPALSPDALRLYYLEQTYDNGIPKTSGVLLATRSNPDEAFGPPTLVSLGADSDPLVGQVALGPAEKSIYAWLGKFDPTNGYSNDRYIRAAINLGAADSGTKFDLPRALDISKETEQRGNDRIPYGIAVSDDDRTILFGSTRATGDVDTFTTTRGSVDSTSWSEPVVVKGAANLSPSWLSPDSCRLYGWRKVGSHSKIHVMTRTR